MVINRQEVLYKLQENRETIQRFGVRRLGLIGSFARGEENADSDLDFVVEFETRSFDAYMDLKAFLEELFEMKVDLVLKEAIKSRLRPAIQADIIYAPGL